MKSFIEGRERDIAYFIPLDGETAEGWNVAIAAEDIPYYYETNWFWKGTYKDMVDLVKEENAKRGITEEEAKRIFDSSIRMRQLCGMG